MPPIRIEGLTKAYKDGPLAVDHVDLEIRDGEFMVLVGPSGCGKSTLLQMLAGIVEATEGRILIGDRDVTRLDPRKRDIAMVFQSYALYPHLSVRGNLGFGLKLRKTGKQQIAERVEEVARTLGLDELLDRKPGELSGGQRQRVAMGRAIVREPRAFLMDEPLSNLDAKLRVSMRAQLGRLHERLGITTVYVTHDQVEAMTLGDRVAVLRRGVLQQCDTPQALFTRPSNLFVAAFIGSPAMNLVEADMRDGDAHFGACRVATGTGLSGRVILGLRPHDLALAGPGADPSWPRIQGRIELVEELGTETQLVVAIDAPRLRLEAVRDALDAAPGDDVLLADDDRAMLTAVVEPRTRPGTPDTVELAIDPAHLHFFDPATGAAIERDGRPVAEQVPA
jgi:multiple sugar transport system ATP-binding protein